MGVKLSLLLSSENCEAYPPNAGYIFSLAFFDDLVGSTERFYVFLGYGNQPGQNRIWYFVFDLDNSDYRYLNCGEFDNILATNGLDTQYFRQLTLAPEVGDGICRLVVGYKENVKVDPHDPDLWKSFFVVGYLTQLPSNRLSFNSYVPDDYRKELRVPPPPSEYFPKPIQYMGVISRDEIYDLVILTVGTITPDDVLFVHKLGDKDNVLRTSSGTWCGPLLDHPCYFVKIRLTEDSSTRTNIAIVRAVRESGHLSFVRYTVEPPLDGFEEYKMILENSESNSEPDIPGECALFHMDSGDMTGDVNGNDDLVVIWKECPEDCELDHYVLQITDISPEDPEDCLKISFDHSFADGFAKGDDIDDLAEPVYIRYTAKDGGYFLSLFYHDSDDGISVHVHEYTFSS